MSSRLTTVLEHLPPARSESDDFKDLRSRLALQSLRAQFTVSKARLKEMAFYMMYEMHRGLEVADHQSTIPMLPSFVTKKDPESASGVFYALDMGGTNFRVIRMVIRHGELIGSTQQAYKIEDRLKKKEATAKDLFGWLAGKMTHFLESREFKEDNMKRDGHTIPLGFTFSFPVSQSAIDVGLLGKWTKEFETSGVVGKEIVSLMQDAMDEKGVNMRVVALCNDTVGTLITRYMSDNTTQLGVILGTGSNACYWEKVENITKLPESIRSRHRGEEMIVNMEFGQFDSELTQVLPVTMFDEELNQASSNTKSQRFEKMISGRYLGEITRRVLEHWGKKQLLNASFAEKFRLSGSPEADEKRFGDLASHASLIVGDRHPGLGLTRKLLKAKYDVDVASEHERYLVREICAIVRHRAAQLAGMAIAATLLKTGKQDNATVAVDGSVFMYTPGFKRIMEDAMTDILGSSARGIRLVGTKDGSGLGAGFIASLQHA